MSVLFQWSETLSGSSLPLVINVRRYEQEHGGLPQIIYDRFMFYVWVTISDESYGG